MQEEQEVVLEDTEQENHDTEQEAEPVKNDTAEPDVNNAMEAELQRLEAEFGEHEKPVKTEETKDEGAEVLPASDGITVYVNHEPVQMTGKESYIFVDIFDKIDFNLNDGRGRSIVTRLNGAEAPYMATLHTGDQIEVYWEEK